MSNPDRRDVLATLRRRRCFAARRRQAAPDAAPYPHREREARHARLAAHLHARRSEDEVPLAAGSRATSRAHSVRPARRSTSSSAPTRRRRFVIDLYRLGYYRGKGGRHLRRLGPFEGKAQPTPPVGEERLRECQWEACTTLDDPEGLAQRRLPRQAVGDEAPLPELRHLHRPRRPAGRLPLPVQRQHLAGLQRLARQLLALRQRPQGRQGRSSPA